MISFDHEYVLLIMNCEKYRYKAEHQKNTWLINLPHDITYYHVLGNANLDTDYLFDHVNRMLTVKTMDDYNSLPKKVIASFQAVHETFPCLKYIFKTDDDQMLTNNKFFNIITSMMSVKSPKIHYGGFQVNIEIPYLSKYYLIHPELPENIVLHRTKYCSGRLYFLSNQSIVNLISKKELIGKEYLEDYAIGFYLSQYYKENMLNIDTSKYFKDFYLEEESQGFSKSVISLV